MDNATKALFVLIAHGFRITRAVEDVLMPDHKLILGRRWLWFCVLAAALIVLVAVATVEWLGPLPPRIVVMSTGAPGSDYELFAARYRAILKRIGQNRGGRGHEIPAAKRPFAACGKLTPMFRVTSRRHCRLILS